MQADAAPHPHYGPCDALADGACAECAKTAPSAAALLRKALRRLKCRRSGHVWEVDDGCRRTCSRCGRYEMLMMRRYPSVDEPSLVWEGADDATRRNSS